MFLLLVSNLCLNVCEYLSECVWMWLYGCVSECLFGCVLLFVFVFGVRTFLNVVLDVFVFEFCLNIVLNLSLCFLNVFWIVLNLFQLIVFHSFVLNGCCMFC